MGTEERWRIMVRTTGGDSRPSNGRLKEPGDLWQRSPPVFDRTREAGSTTTTPAAAKQTFERREGALELPDNLQGGEDERSDKARENGRRRLKAHGAPSSTTHPR